MKKFLLLACLGLMLAGQAAAATTYHVFKAATNVSPNFDNLTSAVQAVNLGTGGDTISIDDSGSYDIGVSLAINRPNTSIVAAAGVNPTLNPLLTGTTAPIQINSQGCRVGSVAGGSITIDGKVIRRIINVACTDKTATGWTGPSTTTFENLVFVNAKVTSNSTNCHLFWLLSDDATTLAPEGTVIDIKYVDFQFPAGKPAVAIANGASYTAIKFHGTNGAILNLENVRANTLCGFIVQCGIHDSDRALQWGTVNVKNCRFVYDDPIGCAYRQMGSPVSIGGGYSGAHVNGWNLNVDNSYLRSNANNNGIWFQTHIAGMSSASVGTRDCSETLGVIFMANNKQNNVTITNSAIVAAGAGVEINSPHARLGLYNSDIYVPTAGQYTQGYFISVAERTAVSTAADLQCSATRCNLYGVQGSRINSGPRPAGSVFSMYQCNDWSAANAYASNWVVDANCVQPGKYPKYGNTSAVGSIETALAAYDVTVYEPTLVGIGAHRQYSMGVPVELSTFSVQ